MKPHLYINSKGYFVTRHSYSGSDSFNYCARKYYLERVQGWSERAQRSSAAFGTVLEKAVTFWHQNKQDTVATRAEFLRSWAEHKDKPYTYTKGDLDWDRLNLTGEELVRLYAIRYPTFPYVVNNPMDFQVQTNLEIFPGTELAGIEFTSYIDLIADLKDSDEPVIIDMKVAGKPVPELTVLDPQLRTYSFVKRQDGGERWKNVAFLWFLKMGRTISRGDKVTFLDPYAGFAAGDDAVVMAQDDFGLWVTSDPQGVEAMNTLFVGESKAVKTARQEYVESHARHVLERAITKQRIQFKMATITKESAEDIGRSIKQDIVNITSATKNDFFPMQSGVRFPNEKCPMCAMRGICSNQPELRDTLLVRKQMEEIDFGNVSE